jgi:hypothetical protein
LKVIQDASQQTTSIIYRIEYIIELPLYLFASPVVALRRDTIGGVRLSREIWSCIRNNRDRDRSSGEKGKDDVWWVNVV